MGASIDLTCAEVLPRLVMALRTAHPSVMSETELEQLRLALRDVRSLGEAWQRGSRTLLDRELPFEVHATWYELLSAHVPHQLLPAWFPDEDALEGSNLARLLTRRGGDYAALHAWSIAHPDAYWDMTLRELGLTFERPAFSMRGKPADVECPEWLEGAALNVARACLEGGADGDVALVSGTSERRVTVTFGELRTLVRRAALEFRRWGVAPGDSVAIALPLGVNAVVAYLALLYLGASAVCIAESYSEEEICTRLEIAAVSRVVSGDVVVRNPKRLPLYAKFERVNAPPVLVIASDPANVCLRKGDILGEDWSCSSKEASPLPGPTGKAAQVEPFAVPIDGANTILFSSGTTGTPKAIPWTPACAIKAAADARWHLDVRAGDRLLWPTSLGWMMGPWSICATLLNGAALVVFEDAPTLRSLGEMVQSERVTHLGVVPSLVRSWRESGAMEGFDWSGLRLFASTGECSNRTDMLYLMWLAKYRPVIEYCGGTEIAGGYITSTLLEGCVPGCFTTPALGQSFVCFDDAGEESNEGEAFLTTPSVGLSTRLLNRCHHDEYYAGVPRPGLRRHGDRIEKVGGVYYRVLGRADDTMNLGGIKVSSAEIERACLDVPGVRELAAIAVAPPGGGPSQLVMCAALEASENVSESELESAFDARIATRVNPLFRVQHVWVLDELPRTASNKVMRRLLRARAAERVPRDLAPTRASERRHA